MEKVRTRGQEGNEDDTAACQIRAWLLVVVRHERNPPGAQAACFRQVSLRSRYQQNFSIMGSEIYNGCMRSKRRVCLVTGLLPLERSLRLYAKAENPMTAQVHAGDRWNGLTPNIFGAATINAAIGGPNEMIPDHGSIKRNMD
jgi:hypothetical protein